MKLLYCLACGDIFSLDVGTLRECGCKLSSGNYRKDGLIADIYTRDSKSAVVLGFANSSFGYAVKDQLICGDLPKGMPYCGKVVSPGRDFKAFIIPESADSVVWHYATE